MNFSETYIFQFITEVMWTIEKTYAKYLKE